jgi:pimeloyl-ACP methyl ester carboxylesterase
MAARYPDKLRAIVLVCPVTPDGRLGRLDRALAGRRAGPLMARAGFLGAGAALAVPPLRRRIAPLVPGADASRWPELRRAWRTFWVEQRALVDELPGLDASFDVPATFVLGERDHVTDPAVARAYAARLGADVIEVAGVGHLLPMQRPAEVARAIEGASGASSGGP